MITGEQLKEIIYQKALKFSRDNEGQAPEFLILDHDTHYELKASCGPADHYDYPTDSYVGMRIALVRLREGEESIIETR